MTEDVDERGGSSCSSCAADLTPHPDPAPLDPLANRFVVRGLDCADEVSALRHALRDLAAPEQLRFDLLSSEMELPRAVDPDAVIAAVSRTGMEAQLLVEGVEIERSWWDRHGRAATTVLSGVALGIGFALHAALGGLHAALGDAGGGGNEAAPIAAMIAYAVSIAGGFALVVPKAWLSLARLRPDMNLLMTIAVVGAIALGAWFEAAAVSFLFALSLLLEAWSVGRARRAVEKLLALSPPRVRIMDGDDATEVDPATVAPGTLFLVLPGERFALDGVVIDGESEVDQAPITGESILVPKSPGNDVYAGTINGNGPLEVRSTRAAADTTLAQIVKMVGEARKDRTEVEQWVERFARIYTPTLFFAAAAVAGIGPLVFEGTHGAWIYRALVLLVIGCPCALVISTPVAVVAGLAAAARHGVLIKGGRYLEIPSRLRVVAMDKTGTLTHGAPQVVNVIPFAPHTEDELLDAAAAIESRSEHPIARAIVARAAARGHALPEARDVEIHPGRGTTGTVNDRTYWLGSHRWLAERLQVTAALEATLAEHSSAGHSVVVIGTDDHVCGIVTLADGLRADAADAVGSLRRAGITRVVMLTGDNEATARAVGDAVAIDDVRAELLPKDKLDAIDELARSHGPVAMIGDGINDAPALARATLGVAMGAVGTDVAIETADVALMSDDLSRLAWLIEHSRKTLGIIRQNTALALGIKLVFVVLTFAGAATLWGAIAADMGASLLVVVNALRLLGASPAATPAMPPA